MLNQRETETLVHAFVTSRLDHCNSILYVVPEYQVAKLQTVQNSAARLVKRVKKYEHVTPLFIELHWLRINQRILFKILLMVFKALNYQAPVYIRNLIHRYNPGVEGLRSSDPDLLLLRREDTPTTTQTYGMRAFNIHAPILWNSLPRDIRQAPDISAFKSRLQTHLFSNQFQ